MLLHAKYKFYMVSEKTFKGSAIKSLWKLMVLRVWPVLTPGA